MNTTYQIRKASEKTIPKNYTGKVILINGAKEYSGGMVNGQYWNNLLQKFVSPNFEICDEVYWLEEIELPEYKEAEEILNNIPHGDAKQWIARRVCIEAIEKALNQKNTQQLSDGWDAATRAVIELLPNGHNYEKSSTNAINKETYLQSLISK